MKTFFRKHRLVLAICAGFVSTSLIAKPVHAVKPGKILVNISPTKGSYTDSHGVKNLTLKSYQNDSNNIMAIPGNPLAAHLNLGFAFMENRNATGPRIDVAININDQRVVRAGHHFNPNQNNVKGDVVLSGICNDGKTPLNVHYQGKSMIFTYKPGSGLLSFTVEGDPACYGDGRNYYFILQ